MTEKALKLLEIDGTVGQTSDENSRRYFLPPNKWQLDIDRYERVRKLRRAGLVQMKSNVQYKDRLMKFLQAAIQKYPISAGRLSAWLEKNLADGFKIFDFPLEHRKLIRNNNRLEQINKEIRRRTRVVGVFPNEAFCLRLISARLMEISEE
jgi:putative transposase